MTLFLRLWVLELNTIYSNLGEGNGSPLQYSCLDNPMDRGDWRATVHRGAELVMTKATECVHI